MYIGDTAYGFRRSKYGNNHISTNSFMIPASRFLTINTDHAAVARAEKAAVAAKREQMELEEERNRIQRELVRIQAMGVGGRAGGCLFMALGSWPRCCLPPSPSRHTPSSYSSQRSHFLSPPLPISAPKQDDALQEQRRWVDRKQELQNSMREGARLNAQIRKIEDAIELEARHDMAAAVVMVVVGRERGRGGGCIDDGGAWCILRLFCG